MLNLDTAYAGAAYVMAWVTIAHLLQVAGISMGVTREELYKQVWAETMLKVAERYKVSSSYMARVCTILRVPRPPVGYWAKVAVSRAPPKPALPKAEPGDQLEWTPGAALYRPLVERAQRRPQRGMLPAASIIPEASEVAASGPHPILVGVRDILDGAKEADNYLKPSKRFMVDILVSKALANTAIETAAAFFQLLESRSHPVRFAQFSMQLSRKDFDLRAAPQGEPPSWPTRWRPDRATIVHIGSVVIGLTLGEMTEELEVVYVKDKYVPVSRLANMPGRARLAASSWKSKMDMPSGRLRLRAYSPYQDTTWSQTWEEKSPGDLASRLDGIVKQLERAEKLIAGLMEEARVRAEARKKEWQDQQVKWDRLVKEQKRQDRRDQSLKELASVFSEWERQHRLDGFFTEMVARTTALPDSERQALRSKMDRARVLLGETDVFVRFASWQPPED